jgi:hypothetical protein
MAGTIHRCNAIVGSAPRWEHPSMPPAFAETAAADDGEADDRLQILPAGEDPVLLVIGGLADALLRLLERCLPQSGISPTSTFHIRGHPSKGVASRRSVRG